MDRRPDIHEPGYDPPCFILALLHRYGPFTGPRGRVRFFPLPDLTSLPESGRTTA